MIQRVRGLIRNIFHWSDLDPDRRGAILLIGGVSLMIIFALLAVGYGYYVDRIAFKQESVLQVGDRKFDYGQLERRLKAELGPNSGINSTQFGQAVGVTLSLLEGEELVSLVAAERNIRVTDEEIDAQIRDELNLSSDVPRDQLARQLRNELLATGLRLEDFRDTARARALALKLRQALDDTVPAEAEQIDVRLLQVRTEAEALDARSRIEGGETLAALAALESIHSSRSSAGELIWIPRGALPEAVEEIAFSIEIGELSEIIEAPDGFYIIEVRGREVRMVEEDGRNQVVNYTLSVILEEMSERVGSEIMLTSDQLSRLAGSIQASFSSGG